MENENKEIQVAQQQALTPAQMIMAAVNEKADLDKVEKLLELQERWEKNEARKAFAKDFAKAQAEIAPVVKKAVNPQTHSKYALLEGVIEMAQPIYTSAGFSVIFYEGETSVPEHIRICADVLHKLGHKETYHYDVPLDGVGIKGNANMTKIHAKASSTSYARRYLMYLIWNIPTTDNDGNNESLECVSEKQLHELRDMLIATEASEAKFCEYLKVEKLESLPVTDYQKAMSALKFSLEKRSMEKKAVKK